MGLVLFLSVHTVSLLICFFATRSTFRYLSKHQITPKHRYMLFRYIRIRHIGLFYISSILILTVYAYTFSLFHTL